MPAYLDHAASTPLRPVARQALVDTLDGLVGNPSGAHRLARDARRAVDDAREVVARALGADLGEVVFTSGGTEADNLAVFGVHDRRGGTLVCSAVEHHAVLDPVVARGGRLVPVDRRGLVDLDALAGALDPSVTLVSVMLANNEVGTIQPLREVAEVVRRHAPDAALHTDAVQAMPWLDVATLAAAADLVSISAHKFGGPKGVGALVVRGRGRELMARSSGGGQERERRHGTQDVAGIVAMAAALQATVAERATTNARVEVLRDRLVAELRAEVPGTLVTGAESVTDGVGVADSDGGSRSPLLPGIAHLCFEGIESEALLLLLEDKEVYASVAASCASGAMEPSHVLAAMGVDRSLAFGSVRLSLGWCSTDADVDLAASVIPDAVARLRRFR